jgi:hypothetical protein
VPQDALAYLKTGHVSNIDHMLPDSASIVQQPHDGREPIVVTHHETTMDQAIRGAVHSLKNSVESALGKEADLDHLRDHH